MDAHHAIDQAARDSYGRLVAFLAARSRDVASGEDALADAFVAQNVVYAVRSEAELVELFENGGFRIESLAFRSIAGAKLLSGPTQGAGSICVQLVAVRR